MKQKQNKQNNKKDPVQDYELIKSKLNQQVEIAVTKEGKNYLQETGRQYILEQLEKNDKINVTINELFVLFGAKYKNSDMLFFKNNVKILTVDQQKNITKNTIKISDLVLICSLTEYGLNYLMNMEWQQNEDFYNDIVDQVIEYGKIKIRLKDLLKIYRKQIATEGLKKVIQNQFTIITK